MAEQMTAQLAVDALANAVALLSPLVQASLTVSAPPIWPWRRADPDCDARCLDEAARGNIHALARVMTRPRLLDLFAGGGGCGAGYAAAGTRTVPGLRARSCPRLPLIANQVPRL